MKNVLKFDLTHKIARYLYIAFFFLSFVSHTFKELGLHLIYSRVTAADLVGGLALILTIPSFVVFFKNCKQFPKVYLFAGLLVLALFFTGIFSLYPIITLVECIIVLFLLLISLGVYISFRETSVILLLSYFMWAVLLFTSIGFYDLVAEHYGFYRIFPVAKYPGVLIGGFKNTGQAGSFFMMIFILLLPLRFSNTVHLLTKKRLWLLDIALLCCIIMLFTLGKYSVILGLIAGITLFIIYLRKKKVIFYFLGIAIFLSLFFGMLKIALPNTYNRAVFKFENRIVKNEIRTTEVGFIENNFSTAIQAFKDHPVTGCGLGTFQCDYGFYEIHSTYLKILGEAGLIGLIFYFLFLIQFLKLFPYSWKPSIHPFKHYLQCLLPLILGALITWIYTYHLRKREFWILLAIVLIVIWKNKNMDKTQDI